MKAIEKFEEAIKLDSKNSDLFFNKAESYKKWAESLNKTNSSRQKYFQNAVLSYDEALKLKKDDHQSYNSRG